MNFSSLSKPSNQRTLTLIILGMLISGTIGFYRILQVKQPEAAQGQGVKTSTPSLQQVTALGRVEPSTEVIQVSVLSKLSEDQVVDLLVQRGDWVEVGEIIAIMGSRNRLQSALLEAQAQTKVAQSELVKVKAGATNGKVSAQEAEIARFEGEFRSEIDTQQAIVKRMQAGVRTAKVDYNRYLLLYEQGVIPSSDLDTKRLALETAQAQLDEAKAKQSQRLDTIREQIKKARATLDDIVEVRSVDIQASQAEVERTIAAAKTAEAELDETYIRAPIAGRILDLYTRPGEVVGENGVALIGQTNQMQVVAEIYQTNITKVREGQQAFITSELFPEKLRGTVDSVGLQVIKQEVTSGEPGENLDRKVIQVRIRLNPEDSRRVANLTNLQVQVAIRTNGSV
ncbi:MAG: HlyD family efflux transporter periplasmic adaptor subunit [Cyanobacteria bacterium P01_A01_bin.40]